MCGALPPDAIMMIILARWTHARKLFSVVDVDACSKPQCHLWGWTSKAGGK
jgi:hypothetical protein